MRVCGCGFEAKSPAGLAAHRRACREKPDASSGLVLEAVRSQLPDGVTPGLRASALRLAAAMDESESVRDLPALARELRATLQQIAESGQDESEADGVDDLAARREARRAAAAGSVGS